MKQGVLGFTIDLSDQNEDVTAHGGLPLVIEALRAVRPKKIYRKLRDALGYTKWKVARRHVESLLALIASGGECLDDLAVLRADRGLCLLLGFVPTSPTQAKDFLYRFHQDEHGRRLTAEQDAQLSVRGKAQIRPEGPALQLLHELVDKVVQKLQANRERRRATLDVDATIIEAHKTSALRAYEGTVGYQPQLGFWAEQSALVTDEFRDGNVPAEFEAMRFLQRCVASLPPSVSEVRLRADSAFYNEDALSWADEQGIQFAVSADMSPSLAKAISAIDDRDWKSYRSLNADEDKDCCSDQRQCAEVVFVPDWRRNHRKDGEPFRYIAIRVRQRQQDLLMDDSQRWRHFAVVTNMKWDGERLLRWQREKQGTVEHAHNVLKNELAAGTMPCGRFGANAAWFRLNVLTCNLLQLIKVVALPPEMANCRPKALRFRLLGIVGRLVQTGHRLILKIAQGHPFAPFYVLARSKILLLAREHPI